MVEYFIPDGYKVNLDEEGNPILQYTSVPVDTTFQVACYKYAKELIATNKFKNCLELGSGSGYKLNKYILPVCKDIYGIDLPHAVNYCQTLYKEINWVEDDFDSNDRSIDRKFDLIICFDVIEHLVFPEKLLKKIKMYSHKNTRVLISTPERDLVRGPDHRGPSPNIKHIREWNRPEFGRFLESQGFKILYHLILPAKKMHLRQRFITWRKGINMKTCQLVDCVVADEQTSS